MAILGAGPGPMPPAACPGLFRGPAGIPASARGTWFYMCLGRAARIIPVHRWVTNSFPGPVGRKHPINIVLAPLARARRLLLPSARSRMRSPAGTPGYARCGHHLVRRRHRRRDLGRTERERDTSSSVGTIVAVMAPTEREDEKSGCYASASSAARRNSSGSGGGGLSGISPGLYAGSRLAGAIARIATPAMMSSVILSARRRDLVLMRTAS